MRAAPLVLSILIAVTSAAPAMAQSRRELDERIAALEALVRGRTDDAAVRNLDRINSLEAQIRSLTGQVEELQFKNRQLETRLETLQEDMMSAYGGGAAFAAGEDGAGPVPLGPGGGEGGDLAAIDPNDPFAQQRAAAVRPLGAGGDVPGARAGGAANMGGGTMGAGELGAEPGVDMNYAPTGDSPDLLFARGRTRLFEGAFTDALEAFAEFLDIAPDDARAGEAYFWVGSIYRTEEQPVEAADALVKSLQADPNGLMAPEAMVQLGAALAAMGETDRACQTLTAATSQYPDMDQTVRATATRERRNAGC